MYWDKKIYKKVKCWSEIPQKEVMQGELVDTVSHASCENRRADRKEMGFPYMWGTQQQLHTNCTTHTTNT